MRYSHLYKWLFFTILLPHYVLCLKEIFHNAANITGISSVRATKKIAFDAGEMLNLKAMKSCHLEPTVSCCSDPSHPVLGGLDMVESRNGNLSQGRPEWTAKVSGRKGGEEYMFWFTSEENLRIFSSQPEAYVPRYGGFDPYYFCASEIKKFSQLLMLTSFEHSIFEAGPVLFSNAMHQTHFRNVGNRDFYVKCGESFTNLQRVTTHVFNTQCFQLPNLIANDTIERNFYKEDLELPASIFEQLNLLSYNPNKKGFSALLENIGTSFHTLKDELEDVMHIGAKNSDAFAQANIFPREFSSAIQTIVKKPDAEVTMKDKRDIPKEFVAYVPKKKPSVLANFALLSIEDQAQNQNMSDLMPNVTQESENTAQNFSVALNGVPQSSFEAHSSTEKTALEPLGIAFAINDRTSNATSQSVVENSPPKNHPIGNGGLADSMNLTFVGGNEVSPPTNEPDPAENMMDSSPENSLTELYEVPNLPFLSSGLFFVTFSVISFILVFGLFHFRARLQGKKRRGCIAAIL